MDRCSLQWKSVFGQFVERCTGLSSAVFEDSSSALSCWLSTVCVFPGYLSFSSPSRPSAHAFKIVTTTHGVETEVL